MAESKEEHDNHSINPADNEPLIGDDDNLRYKVKQPSWKGFIPMRYIVTFMAFAGFFNVYAMRVNLSVALVAMVNSSSNAPPKNYSNACPLPNNQTESDKEGPFQWNPTIQGQILASFFYGYILTQIPGGIIAGKYGAKWPFGIGVLCTTILTVMTPYVAHLSPFALMVLRFLEGLGEGVTFPACHALFSRWAPPLERSKLMAFAYAGSYLGTAVFLPIAGILCDSDFLGGWPSVFYITGACGFIWFILWCLLVSSSPADHFMISQEEVQFISSSLENKKEAGKIPWVSIFTSVPVWALIITHFCNNWAFYTLLTDLPTYFKGVLRFDISKNGLISSLPYISQYIVSNLSGSLADFLRSRNILSTNTTRKLFNTLGFFLQGVFMIGAGLAGCNVVLAVTCLVCAVGSFGITIGGFNVNHLDIAPRYAGVLMGITNTAGTIPGFLGPAVVSLFLSASDDKVQWLKIFIISAAIDVVGLLTFLIFGAGKQQEWAKDKEAY
ncbi:sialin-like [Apostichopus japonicus]|uniref:sialin-like n=1 Tax=Stichopus japonicus TaxID=307972 RepID=UPI003AB1D419